MARVLSVALALAASASLSGALELRTLPSQGAAVAEAANPYLFPSDEFTAFGSEFSQKRPAVAVGLGYQKCGTTVMARILGQHADTINFGAKEKHYLGNGGSQCERPGPPSSLEDYLDSCFGGQRPQKKQTTLDFTPTYGTMAEIGSVIANVQTMSGDVGYRFVMAIRNPASRAASSMGMYRKLALFDYANTTDEQLDNFLKEELLNRKSGKQTRFISDGEYVEPLKVFLKSFPKESLLVVNTEKLGELQTWKRIYKHLGLAVASDDQILEWIEAATLRYQGQQEEKYAATHTQPYKASPAVLEELSGHYEPLNSELWQILGTPAWWGA
mmetsp:Transcript_11632/g.25992  ORF Transcript_11632/g.25992 Transcript_11632/m.25992 type:complete len:329 (-) Transcript_11632:73-1059(-)|eukprot:CAMPEP_0170623492 /NCGR_PEP_ID=MMETSP0224-20130122/29729_1 /TAXON_ID=285029 /ORGANISM="Togula jolla, Strain CCCM 725" /LENGTH=328 /DNA_ID=CAMNT_0010949953 /DNA_START=129 /DNA_END=1115 /DNA_ORIENTATION=+